MNVADVGRYDNVLENLTIIHTHTSTDRHNKISEEFLSGRFGIGI